MRVSSLKIKRKKKEEMVPTAISTFRKMYRHLKNEPLKPDPNLYLYSDTGEIGIISNRKRLQGEK